MAAMERWGLISLLVVTTAIFISANAQDDKKTDGYVDDFDREAALINYGTFPRPSLR